jgi:hypothetical protein
MSNPRPIHPNFLNLLDLKGKSLVEREYVLEMYPDGNELLYHTHVLTSVFSVSEKLSDAYCHIPVYSGHVNLGFNK